MTDLDASAIGEPPPPYMIFLLVIFFFLIGLLGFLICHLLKKKGYRCRTEMDEEEGEDEEKIDNVHDEEEENQDTVEQILKCIIENEANMEAFKEMLGNQNICVRHDPRLLRKESLGGVPPHHHTVHSGSDHTTCHLCVQSRLNKNRRQSRTPRTKQRPGEQTVFSVGRFRVTHTDKKLHGSSHQMADSGEQLEQSQDSEEKSEGGKKDGGYNLKNMFKEVRSPSESFSGSVLNTGKPRKLFGLRRGSDPSGMKMAALPGGGGGRETGGIKFPQQQPVVLEEPLQTSSQTDDTGVRQEIGSKLQTSDGPTQDPATVLVLPKAEMSGPASDSPPSQTQMHTQESCSSSGLGSTNSPMSEKSPASKTIQSSGPTAGDTQTSAPSSLPIPTLISSGQTFNMATPMMERDEKKGEVYSPGPVQTSTPIAPGPASALGFTPASHTSPQPESISSAGLQFTHTPTGPTSTSSLELDPGFEVGLASVSQGSTPISSHPIKSPSPGPSLKTPVSRQELTPSPKLPKTLKNTATEASKPPSPSPVFTPSPKLPSGPKMSKQSPVPLPSNQTSSPLQANSPSFALSPSPKLTTRSETPSSPPVALSPFPAQTSSAESSVSVKSGILSTATPSTLRKDDMITTVISHTERELEEAKSDQKIDTERIGARIDKLSPVSADSKGVVQPSPPELLSKDRLSFLSHPPSSPLSLSSPLGSRISGVTIVRPSPDSKREFSVVTMVDKDESFISAVRDTESENSELSSAVSQVRRERGEISTSEAEKLQGGVKSLGGQKAEPFAAVVVPTVSQEREDIVEMEDIKDCNVRQREESEREEEELGKTVHTQPKQE